MSCTACGDSFNQPPGHRGHPLERCAECRPAAKSKPKPKPKTCPICANEFLGLATRVYCTPACRNEWRAQQSAALRLAARAKTDKLCTKCEQTLPLNEFRKDRKRVDGLYPWCRECWRNYMGTKARNVQSQTKAEYDREYRRVHKDRKKDEWFSNYLWTRYRMTEEEYESLLEAQHHSCAICGTQDAGAARGRANGRFAVDHDHSCCSGSQTCGKCVRGLLCGNCNTGIGMLKDDERRLRAAIRYLRQPKPVVTQAKRDEQLMLHIEGIA